MGLVVVGLLLLGAVASALESPSAPTVAAAEVADEPQRQTGRDLVDPTVARVVAPVPTEPTTTTTTRPTTTTTAATTTTLAREISATVVQVIDGDTIAIELEDGSVDEVRLIGIDAAERGTPSWEEARMTLAELIDGRTVTLLFDTTNRDRYDRLLRYVLIGGLNVNEEMVRKGLAVAREYPPDTAMAEALASAEQAARDDAVGQWTTTTTAPPPITTTTAPPPTTTTSAEVPTTTTSECHPSYQGACVPFTSDVDCAGGSGNGPEYVGTVTVVGPDVYDLDRDNDGVGCEG